MNTHLDEIVNGQLNSVNWPCKIWHCVAIFCFLVKNDQLRNLAQTQAAISSTTQRSHLRWKKQWLSGHNHAGRSLQITAIRTALSALIELCLLFSMTVCHGTPTNSIWTTYRLKQSTWASFLLLTIWISVISSERHVIFIAVHNGRSRSSKVDDYHINCKCIGLYCFLLVINSGRW